MSHEWPERATVILIKGRNKGLQPIEIVRELRAAGYGYSPSAVSGKLIRMERAEEETAAANMQPAEPWRPSLDNRPGWLRLRVDRAR